MKNLIYGVILILALSANLFAQNLTQKVLQKGDDIYLSNVVVVKFKNESLKKQGGNKIDAVNLLLQKLKIENVVEAEQIFKSPERNLENIFSIKYNSGEDPVEVAKRLSEQSKIEWAEPKFIYKIDFVPNDPNYSQQWYLKTIKAEEAWEISKGDSNVVIGIVDTGIDWDHPDLAANIWRNKQEIPNNLIDDDNNGYIDDVRGWDFGGFEGVADNDPNEDAPDHGTHVAGIAAATTNNSIGVAGIGYNSKLMAVKTSINNFRDDNGSPYVVYGYEGIAYAAENGAKIINASWGGSSFSRLGQEVISHAVSLGSLIVGAAGNENSSSMHYPSGYEGVLSVASSTNTDRRSSFSNFGISVDVMAPGSSIYGTWQNDTYATLSGTSMASPLVAGLAALVAAKFPNYNPLQIAEQVRVNTDSIDNLNAGFEFQLGKGRINAFKALNNVNSKSVRAYFIDYSDAAPGGNGNGSFERGEEISVFAKFRNYLNPTSNLSVTLESKDQYVTVSNPTLNFGSISTMDSVINSSNQFKFVISASTPDNYTARFLLKYKDGNYEDYQWLIILINPTYRTQNASNVDVSITGAGNIGFNDFPDNKQGEGFKYKEGQNLLFEGAFLAGVSATKISDAARGENNSQRNRDFQNTLPIQLLIPGPVADQETYSIFNDNSAGTAKIGITVKQKTFSYADEAYNDFVILNYKIINNSGADINNLHAGLFLDWDLEEGSGQNDSARYNSDYNFAYVNHIGGEPKTHVGTALLTDQTVNFYAINNAGDTGFQIYDGFTNQEKWTALSNGLNKTRAFGDISMVFAAGPINLVVNDSVDIAFVLAAGDSLLHLQNAIQSSRTKFADILSDTGNKNQIPQEYTLYQNYPNPFNPATTIKYDLPQSGFVELKVFNLLGETVAVLVNEDQIAGTNFVTFNSSNLSSGIYIYQIKSGNFIQSKKMMLVK